MAASDSTVWMPREVRAYFATLMAVEEARSRSDSRKTGEAVRPHRERNPRAAIKRAAATPAQRGQAIALGMLADLGRQDKDGRTPADRCGFKFRPRGSRQDNVVERYLDAIRALDDPAIESGFLSVLSAIVAEITFECAPDVEYFQKVLKLRPEKLTVPACSDMLDACAKEADVAHASQARKRKEQQ